MPDSMSLSKTHGAAHQKEWVLVYVNFKDQLGCWGNPRRNANCNNDSNCIKHKLHSHTERCGKESSCSKKLGQKVFWAIP